MLNSCGDLGRVAVEGLVSNSLGNLVHDGIQTPVDDNLSCLCIRAMDDRKNFGTLNGWVYTYRELTITKVIP